MRLAMRAGIAIVLVLAVCLMARLAILWSLRQSATISLPGNAGIVTFIRQRQEIISLVDVAYDRKIVYHRANERTRSWKLPVDAGYNMRVNVYWISDSVKSFVRFDDPGDEYLLDLQSNILYLVFPVMGVPYAGQMDDGNTERGWSGPVGGDQSTLSVHVGKHQAVPLAAMVSDPKGTYIGDICGVSHEYRFTPAKDSPETPIKKLFPNEVH